MTTMLHMDVRLEQDRYLSVFYLDVEFLTFERKFQLPALMIRPMLLLQCLEYACNIHSSNQENSPCD